MLNIFILKKISIKFQHKIEAITLLVSVFFRFRQSNIDQNYLFPEYKLKLHQHYQI